MESENSVNLLNSKNSANLGENSNRLFVAYKPSGISSNHFLGKLKRKYGVKSAGFSGTLDPFASGVLVVAFGSFTRFFRFFKKEPKVYRATLWLGASCISQDNENIDSVEVLSKFDESFLKEQISNLVGELTYTPPKFSAKKIDGKRAYEMARNGVEFELKTQKMQVFSCEILSYMHPFLTFEIAVSEGGYIRSFGQILAKNLGVKATLSALERLSEGEFKFQNEKALNPLIYLNLKENFYNGEINDIKFGKKLNSHDFKFSEFGRYIVHLENEFAILEFDESGVKYLLNKVKI